MIKKKIKINEVKNDNIISRIDIKKFYWGLIIAIILMIASIIISVISFFYTISPYTNWTVETTSISIVLSFVGILTTIILIQNYSQLSDVKKEVENRIGKIEIKLEDIRNTIDKDKHYINAANYLSHARIEIVNADILDYYKGKPIHYACTLAFYNLYTALKELDESNDNDKTLFYGIGLAILCISDMTNREKEKDKRYVATDNDTKNKVLTILKKNKEYFNNDTYKYEELYNFIKDIPSHEFYHGKNQEVVEISGQEMEKRKNKQQNPEK